MPEVREAEKIRYNSRLPGVHKAGVAALAEEE